jgi:hypothetical protein
LPCRFARGLRFGFSGGASNKDEDDDDDEDDEEDGKDADSGEGGDNDTDVVDLDRGVFEAKPGHNISAALFA